MARYWIVIDIACYLTLENEFMFANYFIWDWNWKRSFIRGILRFFPYNFLMKSVAVAKMLRATKHSQNLICLIASDRKNPYGFSENSYLAIYFEYLFGTMAFYARKSVAIVLAIRPIVTNQPKISALEHPILTTSCVCVCVCDVMWIILESSTEWHQITNSCHCRIA